MFSREFLSISHRNGPGILLNSLRLYPKLEVVDSFSLGIMLFSAMVGMILALLFVFVKYRQVRN